MPLTPEEQADIEERFKTIEEQIRRLKRKSNFDPRIPLLATGFDVEDAIFNSYVLLNSATLGADSQTLADFTAIPTTYRNLRVVWHGKSASGGSAQRNVVVRFNNDSAAHYHHQIFTDGAANQALGAGQGIVGGVDGVTEGRETWGTIDILNYTETSTARGFTFAGGYMNTGTNIVYRNGTGLWFGVADAIDRVTIFSDAATAGFFSGSTCYLYGY